MSTLKEHGIIGTWKYKPQDIVETYIWSQSQGDTVSIAKPGYKVKKAVMTYSCYNGSGSGWIDRALGLSEGISGGKAYYSLLRGGSGYGYSTYGAHKYGAAWSSNSEVWNSYPGTSHNKYGGASELTLTETGASVKIGQTFGTWLYQDSWTYQTTEQEYINRIFNSESLSYVLYGSDRLSEYSNVTVEITYTAR